MYLSDRLEFENRKIDCVLGTRNKNYTSLMSLVKRKKRFRIVLKVLRKIKIYRKCN